MRFAEKFLTLYAVTDRTWCGPQSLTAQIESALKGGVTMVQLREKELDDVSFLEEAMDVRKLTKRYGVPLIINDRAEIAVRAGADGVHVGQEDEDATRVREILGPEGILGVTAKTVDQAMLAQKNGADYIGVGAVFGSSTKKNAVGITMERLREVCESVSIPAVAIGGISAENASKLTASPVAGIAVVSALFAARDIETEAVRLRLLAEEIRRRQ